MREYLRRAGGKIGSSLERYRSFSGLQRILLVLFGGGVLVLLVMVLVAGGATGYREVLSESDRDGAVRLHEAATLLDRHGIPWKPTTREDGVRGIAVPEGAPHERAQALLVGPDVPAASLGPGSFKDTSPWETQDRRNSRLREFNCHKIEQAICWNPDILHANIVLSPAPGRRALEPGGFRKGGSSGGSAAVAVRLRHGVAALTRREADDLCAMVSCGFNISPENISISDGYLTHWGRAASQLEAEGLEEKEERLCARVREEIRKHYSTAFAEDEFQVGVIASVSPRRSSIEEKAVDRDNSFSLHTRTEYQKGGPPSGGIMFASGEPQQPVSVREVSESIPLESWRKTQTDVPPGEVKGVSVIVHLDLAAVERVDARRRQGTIGDRADESPRGLVFDRDGFLDRYAALQETALRNLLGVLVDHHADGGISVGVMIHPFSRTLAEGAALSSTLAAATDGLPSAEPPAGSTSGWRSATVGIALGLGLLFAGAAVLLRRGSRRAETLAASTPAGGAQSGVEAPGAGGAPHLSRAGFRLRRAGFPADELHDAVLGAVGEMSASVRERPETASSVLRLWLAQDREDAKERAHRA